MKFFQILAAGLLCYFTRITECQISSSEDVEGAECAPSDMARCTNSLKVVTDNRDLGFATSLDELRDMCPKLMSGLRCIDDFTQRCLDREHRAYFNTLYAGTTQVIVDLCHEGPYQSDYLRHAPCMRMVQSGYERCAMNYQQRIKTLNSPNEPPPPAASQQLSGPGSAEYLDEYEYIYDYEEDEVNKKRRRRRRRRQTDAKSGGEESVQVLCCSFQKYLHCSESVVNATCGHETAKFTKSFLDRMSGPLIQGHCQSYEYGSEGCHLHQSEWSSNQQQHSLHPQYSGAKLHYPAISLTIALLILAPAAIPLPASIFKI